MSQSDHLEPIRRFFGEKFASHGATPHGLDWPSQSAMDIRFEQILKVCDTSQPFTLIDFGCGYGAMLEYLKTKKIQCDYYGYDIVPDMVEEAKRTFGMMPHCHFTNDAATLPVCDYVVESGIFNVRLNANEQEWTEHILATLHHFDHLCRRGFAFNMLTSYSDREYIQNRPDLYYADPCFFFDYCKKHFSRNIALLHDYVIYDFTILVRKDQPGF